VLLVTARFAAEPCLAARRTGTDAQIRGNPDATEHRRPHWEAACTAETPNCARAAFSYAEVRHVSLTVTRSASDDPLAQFFVYMKVHRADGSTLDFCIAIVGPDHTNAVLEFDADGWFIQGAPGTDVVELAYGYTVTYPGLIE
jgi:hypothetical protein